MSQSINFQQRQAQTIQYIKRIVKQLQLNTQQSIKDDSLVISSQGTGSINFDFIFDRQKSKSKKKTKYKSPYNQKNMTINKIQQSNKKRTTQMINFQNKILQQITFRTQSSKSRRSKGPSISNFSKMTASKGKFDEIQLEKLKVQAQKEYENKCVHTKQLSPLKSKQVWSDFLLRSRRWQAQKQQNRFILKNKYREKPYEKSISPRKPTKWNNDELIEMFKRKKAKLEQRLKQITPEIYTSFHKKNQKQNRSRPKHIRLSHSMELDFLNYRSNK